MFTEPHLARRGANHLPLTPLTFLLRSVNAHGDRNAVAWRDRVWTYKEFSDMVARLAGWLAARGIGPGDVVSVRLTNRPEMLAAHFAVPALGAVLNTVNTRISQDEVSYILEHSGSRLLLCEESTDPHFADPTVPVMRVADPEGGEGVDIYRGEVPPIALLEAVTDEWQPIALNYTSGTTGLPKGVVYTHRGAAMNALGNVLAMGFTDQTRYLWTLPMFHCNGWCHTWAVAAAGGLNICLERVEPDVILERIEDWAVSHMACAPVVLYMLLDQTRADFRADVKIATGGAAPTPALLEGLEARGFSLVHLYGLTESYGPVTLNDPAGRTFDGVVDKARDLARQGVGHLLTGRVSVVDEVGYDVPADGQAIGEIVIRSNTLMAGYFRNPAETEEAFRDDCFHTGDLAVLHVDGMIEIKDRAKDVIITGGENVSSVEIENALHKHPDILLAAVVAGPDEKWGEIPWAFVELRPGRHLDAAGLEAFCKANLSGFKRPRRFVFGTLPRTATGKIQKFILRDRARAGVDV